MLTDGCRNQTDINDQIANIFNIVWKKNGLTVNVFILSECNHELTIATAKPFSAENICRSVEKNGLRFIPAESDEEKHLNFVRYNPESFNGCNIVAGTKPNPPYIVGNLIGDENAIQYEYFGGNELEFMRLLSKKLNFTLSFKNPISTESAAWYERLPNGTIIGFLRDVMEYRLDIIFGGLMPYYATYYHFQFSLSHTFNSLNWYVTDPNNIPQWKIIFEVFPVEIWILIAFVFLFVCLLYWIMERFSSIGTNLFLNFDFNKTPFANLFSVGLGLSSTLNPKRGYLRLLFVFWAVYCLHWNMAYTSVLFALMTNPPLEKEIANIQDLYESGFKTSIDKIYTCIFLTALRLIKLQERFWITILCVLVWLPALNSSSDTEILV
ncbi:uncharacterized protein LOC124355843 [Homalodisca vitripennis]|uniref:uncharacterized protein LOC124355843 n=1 Tax=Homalodisca vitripennis TaxID=197043 RepID=UPI001EEB4B02|nr:uncharacterized protein LOC124355843 [Homalodisca vitripennis]